MLYVSARLAVDAAYFKCVATLAPIPPGTACPGPRPRVPPPPAFGPRPCMTNRGLSCVASSRRGIPPWPGSMFSAARGAVFCLACRSLMRLSPVPAAHRAADATAPLRRARFAGGQMASARSAPLPPDAAPHPCLGPVPAASPLACAGPRALMAGLEGIAPRGRVWTTCSQRLCSTVRPPTHGHHGGAGRRGAYGLGRRRGARCDGRRPFVAAVTQAPPTGGTRRRYGAMYEW